MSCSMQQGCVQQYGIHAVHTDWSRSFAQYLSPAAPLTAQSVPHVGVDIQLLGGSFAKGCCSERLEHPALSTTVRQCIAEHSVTHNPPGSSAARTQAAQPGPQYGCNALAGYVTPSSNPLGSCAAAAVARSSSETAAPLGSSSAIRQGMAAPSVRHSTTCTVRRRLSGSGRDRYMLRRAGGEHRRRSAWAMRREMLAVVDCGWYWIVSEVGVARL